MKLAVIDLGTNTFNVLLCDITDRGKWQMLLTAKIPVKLGQGGIDKNHIAPDAFQRGIQAIGEHLKTIAHYGIENIMAFATSAFRGADNGKEFTDKVFELYGLPIQVISGTREAELIHKGVQAAIPLTSTPDLIMDIGGGSTEFILCNNREVFWQKSYKLGVSRLLEKFKPSDPITEEDEARILEHVNKKLVDLLAACREHPPRRLIGSSGSFDTLAEMILVQLYQQEEPLIQSGFSFREDDFENIYNRVRHSTLAERLQMPGLIPMRADMIVLSLMLMKHVLNEARLEQMLLSTYALKEGVINELSEKLFHG